MTVAGASQSITGRDNVGKKLAFWVMFSIVFGILPLLVGSLRATMKGDFQLDPLLSSGELFISSAAIAAASIGEVLYVAFQEGPKFGHGKQVACGFSAFMSLLCLIACTVAFIDVAQSDPVTIRELSLSLFAVTVVSALSCVGLAATR